MILPRVFEIKEDNPNYEKYKHHIGKAKLSYSQINAWIDPTYKYDYIKSYFANVRSESGIFAEFGSAVGEFIEYKAKNEERISEMLSESDVDIILNEVDFPKNCVYEDMVVIELADNLVMEGYIDRCLYLPNKEVVIRDYKTGNIKTKASYYGSNEYLQTQLYMYQKIKEGYKCGGCEVLMLGRAGNGVGNNNLRLTGESLLIQNGYDEKLIKEYLKNAKKVAKEISELYKTYIKYFE